MSSRSQGSRSGTAASKCVRTQKHGTVTKMDLAGYQEKGLKGTAVRWKPPRASLISRRVLSALKLNGVSPSACACCRASSLVIREIANAARQILSGRLLAGVSSPAVL